MKQHDKFLMFGLSGISIISSFFFIMYGMNIIMADIAAHGLMVFAYVTTAYGLANVTILSLAWSSREKWAGVANKFIALCYLGVFVMDMINKSNQSPLGAIGILLVAVILLANWFAVTKVIERD